jgi:hypothetical protein
LVITDLQFWCTSVDDQSIRSVIDEIALQVADPDRDDLQSVVADMTVEYINTLRERKPGLSEPELDRIATAILNGVLQRLVQMAVSGGQIGSA